MGKGASKNRQESIYTLRVPECDSLESLENGLVVQNTRSDKQESGGMVVRNVIDNFDEDVGMESRQ